jgi:hypothetical protein
MQKRFSLPRLPASAALLALVAAAFSLAPALRAQSVLYITQTSGAGTLAAYNLSNAQPYAAGSALTTTTFGSPFFQAVATDAAGNVYVAYPAGSVDVLRKYDNTGALLTPFGTNTYYPSNSIVRTATVNSAGTQLILPINAATNQVLSFSTVDGSLVSGFTAINLNNPTAVAFNSSGTFLYATMPSGALQGSTITQYSINGGSGTNLTFTGGGYGNNGFDNAQGLLFQSDTSMIVVSTSLGAVERYTLSGTVATLDTTFGVNGVVTLPSLSGGIAADGSTGNLYVVTGSNIAQLSANGTILNSAYLSGLTDPHSQLAIGLAAVPEPDTAVLLALGLTGMGARRWRRKNG